jgi:hypothetical protein
MAACDAGLTDRRFSEEQGARPHRRRKEHWYRGRGGPAGQNRFLMNGLSIPNNDEKAGGGMISSLRREKIYCLALAIGIALLLSGCATPIGVRYVEPRIAYHSLTANVLSAERPSSFSARELMNLNLYERFEEEPQKALAEMHSGLASKGDEDRVFALAELSFVHAGNSGERSYYLAAAVYAYAFLLPGQHGTAPRGIDPRFRWARPIFTTRRSPVPRC